ncbi:MAG: PAS domain S-box protein, partial [Planctomycetes bacterium]|nr:PAS domain S-box protein [Planctomycetota bacterium]
MTNDRTNAHRSLLPAGWHRIGTWLFASGSVAAICVADIVLPESVPVILAYPALVTIVRSRAMPAYAALSTLGLLTGFVIELSGLSSGGYALHLGVLGLVWLIVIVHWFLRSIRIRHAITEMFTGQSIFASCIVNAAGNIVWLNDTALALFTGTLRIHRGRPATLTFRETFGEEAGVLFPKDAAPNDRSPQRVSCRTQNEKKPYTIVSLPLFVDGRARGDRLILCREDTTTDLHRWFSEVVVGMPYAAVLTDLTGRILHTSTKTNWLFGYSPGELEGKPVHTLVPERHRKQNARSHESSIIRPTTGKLGMPSSYTGLRKDGGEFPMEFWVSEIAFPGETRVLYTIVDAGERRRAEAWFELAVEASPTGMLMVDSDGKIVLVNQQIERLFEYSKDELIDSKIELLVPERFRIQHPMLRERYLERPEVRAMGAGRDLFGRRKDGSEFPVEIGLNPLRTSAGVMVLCSIVDITERKSAEFQLARKADELLRTNEELDDFAYVASHDLQEPLLKVQSFGDLLAEEYGDKLGEEGADYVKRMQGATRRMKTLITDLLNYSRVKRSKERFMLVDLSQTVRDVLADLEVRVQELRARINVGELPEVEADAMQMRQLLQNLIGNALKYHRNGHPPEIVVAAKSGKIEAEGGDEGKTGLVQQAAEISIRDNGIGFDQ